MLFCHLRSDQFFLIDVLLLSLVKERQRRLRVMVCYQRNKKNAEPVLLKGSTA